MPPIVLSLLLAPVILLQAGGETSTPGDGAPLYPDHGRLLVVRDAAGAEWPVRTAADWQERRSHIMVHVQEVMGPLPAPTRRTPLDIQELDRTEHAAYTRIKLTYQAEPGDRVTAWLLVPKGGPSESLRPAALCLHQTVAIGKDEPVGLGGRPTLRYGQELAERGYVVLAPDYPGFGESKTDPYALGYASACMKAIWNNIRGIDLLVARPDVDPERIAVIGHSLGGHTAIFTALFEPRIRAVVSSCGFNSFAHYKGGDLTGWSHRGYMPRIASQYGARGERMPFDFPELIAALAPRAFFTNSPLKDANFPVEGVRICIDAASDVYILLGVPNALRADYPDCEHDFPDAEREAAYDFLSEALR